MKKLSLLIIVLTLLVSCKNTEDNSNNKQQEAITESINEDEIKAVANQFLELVHGKINFNKMKEMYLDMPRFMVWGIDGHAVEGVDQVDDAVIVTATIDSRDPEEVGNSSTLLLKLKKFDGDWKIINTKGLANFRENEMAYAIENNFIQENDDLWDVDKMMAIKKSKRKN